MTLEKTQETQAALDSAAKPWTRYYDPGVPTTIDYPQVALPTLLSRSARAHPNRAALRFLGGTTSYSRLASLVDRFAGALRDLGVRKGDRVAIMLPNCPQFVIAFYGTLRIGAIAVPTNPLYKQHEIAHQLKDSGSETLVTLDLLYATAKKALPGTPVRNTIVTGVQDFLAPYKVPFYKRRVAKAGTAVPDLKGEPIPSFADMLKHQRYTEATAASFDDVAILQYTGGTTGVSKGAVLTHRNLVSNAIQTRSWSPSVPGEVGSTLCVTPFFHVYGLTVCMNNTIYAGGTMLLIPRFTPPDMLAAVRKFRPKYFPGVPTMYMALASEPGIKPDDCASLEVCISGSAPLPREVQEAFETKTGGKVVEGYGLTEASPVVIANPLRRSKIGKIGLPFPDTEIKMVQRDSEEPVPLGEEGELLVRGPQVMREYWNRPDETAKVLTSDGWLRTGDIGSLDEEGYVAILDRAKDIIIAGGFNIYPREVEDVLFQHPAVAEAAVAGVPDDYRGETVKAFIVLKPGTTATEKEIISFTRDHLAAFKAPSFVEFRTELPKTTVGKVLRRELAASHVKPDKK